MPVSQKIVNNAVTRDAPISIPGIGSIGAKWEYLHRWLRVGIGSIDTSIW